MPRTAGGDLVGAVVPYADAAPATPVDGDDMPGPIRTAAGQPVGRVALYQVSGGVAQPITNLGGSASEEVTAQPPIVATPTGANVELSLTTDVPNGVPLLDGTGLIKLAQMPISGLNYHGNWDASTNTPTLADGAGTPGDTYRVHVAGTRDLGSGPIDFEVGDLVVYEGAVWQLFEAAAGVVSVNGQTGAVTLTKADVGLGNVDNTSDANKPVSTAAQTALNAKFTTPTPLTPRVVFGTTLSTNVPGLVGYDQDPTGDSLVMRRFSGAVAATDAAQTDEAVTLAQLNAAIAGIGTQSDLGTPQSHTSTDVFLTQSSPTVQLVDNSAGDTLVHLPETGQVTAGKRFIIKRVSAGSHGFDIMSGDEPTGALIDGVTSIGIAAQWSVREVVFDGTNWQIIGTSGS
jgi:hypothetical protein